MSFRYLLSIILLYSNTGAWAQFQPVYYKHIAKADSLFKTKAYLPSAAEYSQAFAASGNLGFANDRYMAACAWALSDQPDSAFVQLFRIAKRTDLLKYLDYKADKDLGSLHLSSKWRLLIATIDSGRGATPSKSNDLTRTLEKVVDSDQGLRTYSQIIELKYGLASSEFKNAWDSIRTVDASNALVVESILDKDGWVGPEQIGEKASSAFFLIIQHADAGTRRKYFPMMKAAVTQGKANPQDLALLEDRMAVDNGKPQIYGTQLLMDQASGSYYLYRLSDPDSVDTRRARVGLGTLAAYLNGWNIVWNVEEYKRSHK
jgi:hypothetical protein